MQENSTSNNLNAEIPENSTSNKIKDLCSQKPKLPILTIIRPRLLTPNPKIKTRSGVTTAEVMPAELTKKKVTTTEVTATGITTSVVMITGVRTEDTTTGVANMRFLPERVEYYSWTPEGIYTDYDGKIWYLPNHIQYSEWVNQEFITIFDQKFYVEKDRVDRPPLFNYQFFIKSYFRPASPYRGILLNHHMGSGKSRTAIVTAEQFRKAGYKMIFMLPASLRDNAISEIRLWGDSDLSLPPGFSNMSEFEQLRITNELNTKIRKAYHFISYNSSRVLQDLAKIELSDACILIDEVHDLINTMANEAGKTGKMIYEAFMTARNCRFIAMSGTPPPINYPHELGLLFNFLRGPMPIGNLQGIDRLTAYPEDRSEFDDLYVDYKTKKLKNEELFRRRGIGLTSFFHGANRDLYPTVIKLPVFKCVMEKVQFDGYLRARRDEILRESKRSGRLLGPNTFRPNSRQFCNFGMPLQIDRPVSLSKFKQITFSNPQLNSFECFWTDHQKNELDDLFFCLFQQRSSHDHADFEEKEIERISRNFRARWASFKDSKARLSYLINLIAEAGRVGAYEHIVTRNEEIAVLQPHHNQNSVEVALSQLSGPYKNYLLEDLSQSSQKHLKMHQNIESGPGHEGPIFVYSSFRTLEGIEIFSRELDLRGYRKFDPSRDLIRGSSNQDLQDLDKPRLYAILSGTESTELRTQILNFFNHPRNIRGAYLKILLGTSASAQGLSLLNCRQVHIMEPWWTLVLIQQVIGRVCRIRSHHALPIEERKVHVYEYLSTLTKEQASLIGNEELSTDEYLYHKAIEKDELNQQFYVLLKEIAIDFVISAKENRPLENGLRTDSSNLIGSEKASKTVWTRSLGDSCSTARPKYNYLPNMFEEFINFTEPTLSILSNTSTMSKTRIGVEAENSKGKVVSEVIEKKYIGISISGEQYIYFLNENASNSKKPIIVKRLFKGEKTPIKVIELYDYRSMKYSRSCVLRAYVDEAGRKREISDLADLSENSRSYK